jgi:hypothetical protein
MASGPVFKFCAPGCIFSGTEGVGPRFHVLRSRTRFRRYRGRRVPFSSFAISNSISMVPTASGSVFMFCAPGPVFGGTGGVRHRFHILRSRSRFRRYQRHWVPFSCFSLSDPFSTVPTASCAVFMVCAPRLNFGGTEGVGFRVHVLRSRNRFRRYRGIGSCYHFLRSRTHFQRYRGRRVRFSFFALPDPFFVVPTASVPVLLFCAPEPILGGTDGVGSRFHVLRSRTHFRQYRGRRVTFSYFALHDSFTAVPRVSGPVFLFCAPRPIFDGTNDVGSRFHVLRSRTHFRRFRGR